MIASDFKERSSFRIEIAIQVLYVQDVQFHIYKAFMTGEKPTDIEVAVVGDNVPFHSMGTTDIEDILQTIAERE